jgi:hypothetical protein
VTKPDTRLRVYSHALLQYPQEGPLRWRIGYLATATPEPGLIRVSRAVAEQICRDVAQLRAEAIDAAMAGAEFYEDALAEVDATMRGCTWTVSTSSRTGATSKATATHCARQTPTPAAGTPSASASSGARSPSTAATPSATTAPSRRRPRPPTGHTSAVSPVRPWPCSTLPGGPASPWRTSTAAPSRPTAEP